MNTNAFEALDSGTIAAALRAPARFSLALLDSCASTSTLLLDRAQQGAPSGSVVVCERQTAGRGRRGRGWLSAPGDSLTFSLLWRFPDGTPPLAGLSLAVGVAVARTLEGLGAAGVRLKWPNDIFADGAKLGGILVETLSTGGRHAAVIGIGLNVRLPCEIAAAIDAPAGALDALMPFAPSRNLLLAGLLDGLAAMLDEFARDGFAGLIGEWLARNAHAGQIVRIQAEGAAPVEGCCVGVDADGALLLETDTGLRRIVSGEVSLRLP
ncbi:MAG: Bifunctional ligase/repressor BirA [Rhodocyclaceae bacterium]|nr:MAG: biotin--[acetyl-CoA-carboxylase] ligase [Rhodocyclaceae bacterium]MBE7423665.1 biotin--[acetyl-CoA-carboxylase] ligase [Zoogloeaceae bacterium]MBV6406462.1 Bifunctional ligase/repressor BirA [Rhodocyclaceae bacterium]MCK6385403.1 biotin--[acetyl-CoA-carboxylase] ligase [Rhodocyclaceae bacterium]CAG0943306.1 BirA family transcriptional regulator, biotin operon repressor / biotin---[acetyl-CoA-carboxylase] ligase [Gammaproteobacteria bacterium]